MMMMMMMMMNLVKTIIIVNNLNIYYGNKRAEMYHSNRIIEQSMMTEN